MNSQQSDQDAAPWSSRKEVTEGRMDGALPAAEPLPSTMSHDFAMAAKMLVPSDVWDYFEGGAGSGETVCANEEAFRRLALLPRVLRDVGNRHLDTCFLGQAVEAPIGIAPMAYQRLAHPDGELATAQAAAGAGLVAIMSTFGSQSLEQVAETAVGTYWFQLYWLRNHAIRRELTLRAEAAGYKALVVTVDAPVAGYRDGEKHQPFRLPLDIRAANLDETLVSGERPVSLLADQLVDPAFRWADVEDLCETSSLPVVLKGILAPEDAERAVLAGVAAVVVSNHGGRQIDGGVSSVEMLPDAVAAVRGRCEVYVDGGVRRGSDVAKCLALGARGVFVGRPILWGLAVNGRNGVEDVLRGLRCELDVTMATCGAAAVTDLVPEMVRPRWVGFA